MSSSIPSASSHTDAWVQTPDGRLFVRVWSASGAEGHAPIVLLHDSLGCIELWRDFPAALREATGRTVIAYDRPGFGRSDARTEAPALSFIADEAPTAFSAVRAWLGLERFVVFGHSVGGCMAAHCAARFADDCVALVIESAPVFVEDRTLHGIRKARELFADAGQMDRLGRFHGAKAQWVLDAWVDTWLSPDFASWSLAPLLPHVKCPTLAIHGADDEYGSERHPRLIAQRAAGPVREALMPDTRHVPHRERPQAVLALLTEFLQPIA